MRVLHSATCTCQGKYDLPYLGHRERSVSTPGVSQLMTEVGEAGDVEVTGLDIQGVQTDIQLTGNLPQWSTLRSLEILCHIAIIASIMCGTCVVMA